MRLEMGAHASFPEEDLVEIATWKEHTPLHAWMERLFRKRGEVREFNGESVEITAYDLKALEAQMKWWAVTPADYPDENRRMDLVFLQRARYWIAKDFIIYYYSDLRKD